MTVQFSPIAIDQIAKGQAILFLGAGASRMAKSVGGGHGLSGNELRDKLCDHFLGGAQKSRTLRYVGDVIKSQHGLLPMQRYISSQFRGLTPTESHLQLPLFRWKAIFTTNYDQLIEEAYSKCEGRVQDIKPIISDDDDFQSVIDNPKGLPLLKLHGCISRDSDQQLPFILSSFEYSRYKNRRTRLFDYLKEWGRSHPIVFCGYDISDENILEILFDLSDSTVSRPRFLHINPSIDLFDISLWAGRRVDAFNGTFDDLVTSLSEVITPQKRLLANAIPASTSILSKFIPSHERPSLELLAYIESELELVYAGMGTAIPKPLDFYKGFSDSWDWLSPELDIPRDASEELRLELEAAMALANDKIALILLKGYAGSGKSVVLRRTAWQRVHSSAMPVFYVSDGSHLRAEQIHELYHLLNERVTIFIDDIINYISDVKRLIRDLSARQVPITIVGAARTNEWNVDGAPLTPFVTREFELLDLNDTDAQRLLAKLRDNKCLGYLERFEHAEAMQYFKSALEHQLLVGLHQATLGPDLEKTILNEYINIVPKEAQTLYRDICTLHQFGVPVRAGLMSRVSGITIEDFRNKLLLPLEHVVKVSHYAKAADFAYRSRHREIAEIVFTQVFSDEIAKRDQLIRLVRCLNVSYSTDREAMIAIIRSKTLSDTFSDKASAHAILDAARIAGVEAEEVDQHRALLEVRHKGGDIRAALSFIERAFLHARNERPNRASYHVRANILRRLANVGGTTAIEKSKRRSEAVSILRRLIADKTDSRPYHLLAETLLDELHDSLAEADLKTESSKKLITGLVRDLESLLQQSKQIFPDDEYISDASAKLAETLNNHPKALQVLDAAFKSNNQSSYIAIRLARQHSDKGQFDEACAVLRRALSLNTKDKDLHLALAKGLRDLNEHANIADIEAHLRKSFIDGDSRYDARLLYARHLYLFVDRAVAKKEFLLLGRLPIPPARLNATRGIILNPDKTKARFQGTVTSAKPGYCFVRCNELGDEIFLSYRNAKLGQVARIVYGATLEFSVGFSLRGPQATDASVVKSPVSAQEDLLSRLSSKP